jgi:Fungal protein kinase
MELWVFDRSGAYSCMPFDIEQRPDLFIKAMAGYTMMSDEEVGFNLFVQEDTLGLYIVFSDGSRVKAERLYLEDQAIVAAQYLVGTGTTCYAARRPTSSSLEFVVKFVWRENERHVERELLELAKERNVWGVVKLFGCQDLESIANLRRGLHFSLPYKFLSTAANQSTSTSTTGIDEQAFVNRTFSCMVTSPLGRRINEFESVLEFLEVCRDVVKGLRSLYQDGKILHRDVCTNNVIIAPAGSGDAKGVLIDLDAALDLANAPIKREMIGLDGFMALGVLQRDPHTYRHDLESLFYIFLWVAICYDAKLSRYPPRTSRLWGWCGIKFDVVSQNKTKDMQPEQFMNIVDEFSPPFKHLRGLAKELHQLLFPIREGLLFIGTDSDQESVDNLYNGMINAFDRSIVSQSQR